MEFLAAKTTSELYYDSSGHCRPPYYLLYSTVQYSLVTTQCLPAVCTLRYRSRPGTRPYMTGACEGPRFGWSYALRSPEPSDYLMPQPHLLRRYQVHTRPRHVFLCARNLKGGRCCFRFRESRVSQRCRPPTAASQTDSQPASSHSAHPYLTSLFPGAPPNDLTAIDLPIHHHPITSLPTDTLEPDPRTTHH